MDYYEILIIGSKVIGWLIFSYVFASFFEFQIHRQLMHRKPLPDWVYRKSFYVLETFQAHAVRHHRKWYREFDHESDPHGREENLEIKTAETIVILAAFAPLLGTIIWFFPIGGTVLVIISILHNRLWNILHRQMHIPRDSFFKDWPVFQFLARHHFMHHIQMGKNFNVVFPLWDHLLSCAAKPNFSNIREMLRLGHLRPRHPGTQSRLDNWGQEVSLRRAA